MNMTRFCWTSSFRTATGSRFSAECKELDPFRAVVMTSSLESVEAWNDAFAAGADYYLEKREFLALHRRKVELLLRNLIERNRLRRESEESAQTTSRAPVSALS